MKVLPVIKHWMFSDPKSYGLLDIIRKTAPRFAPHPRRRLRARVYDPHRDPRRIEKRRRKRKLQRQARRIERFHRK